VLKFKNKYGRLRVKHRGTFNVAFTFTFKFTSVKTSMLRVTVFNKLHLFSLAQQFHLNSKCYFLKCATCSNKNVAYEDIIYRIVSSLGNLRKRDHWGDPCVDGRIILKCIFKK
jgi:hypothetical protein